MPSPAHEAIVAMLRGRPDAEEEPSVEQVRAGFAQMMKLFPVLPDAHCEAAKLGGVPVEWVSVPGSREDVAVVYYHGGGYVIGSLDTHRAAVSRIARAAGCRVAMVDYRLAPEHPFPAAVDDGVAAYEGALAEGLAPGRVVLMGDSAGGGLTLATLIALRDKGAPLPAAGVAMSPWVDLELTGASAQPGAVDDPLVTRETLLRFTSYYAPDRAAEPTASPVGADLSGLPPLLIQVGTLETLLDDAVRLAERARAAGVDVELERCEGLMHVWQLFGDGVPEAVEAIERIGAFVRKRV